VIRAKGRWGLLGAVLILAAAGIAIRVWPRPAPGGVTARSGNSGSPSGSRASESPAARLKLSLPPDPRQHMLLGAFTDLAGETSQEAAVEQRESAMGRRYDLEVIYYRWDDPFPDTGEAAMVAHRRMPVMTWYGPGKDGGDRRTLEEINNGHDDTWILRQAYAIKSFGHRIYLRLMPEMNGNWYRGFSGHPAAYISAWRRIHHLFDQAGATNVTWVWCPNISPDGWDVYYPGDAYVDVIGVDGFSNTNYRWQTFDMMLGAFFRHYAGRKPLLVSETATNSGDGYPAAHIDSAATFINGMRSYLKNVAGPRYGVIAVCWFDTNTLDGYDWRVNQTPGARQAWLSLARDPYFGGHGS
jgi:hypothetical protein